MIENYNFATVDNFLYLELKFSYNDEIRARLFPANRVNFSLQKLFRLKGLTIVLPVQDDNLASLYVFLKDWDSYEGKLRSRIREMNPSMNFWLLSGGWMIPWPMYKDKLYERYYDRLMVDKICLEKFIRAISMVEKEEEIDTAPIMAWVWKPGTL